ncbi:MAG: hypothetical protein E4G99_13670 [Anaerolineales bacterium]|nr:MAG: hypothetical protein E4G99_13670 [Anaerolineales bacterium]
MAEYQAPTTCVKCGGNMEEGLAVDNAKIVPEGYPAFGKNVTLGGSASWWQIVPAQPNTKAGPFGESFMADKVLAGERQQIFTYCCSSCGYLEAYAPKL